MSDTQTGEASTASHILLAIILLVFGLGLAGICYGALTQEPMCGGTVMAAGDECRDLNTGRIQTAEEMDGSGTGSIIGIVIGLGIAGFGVVSAITPFLRQTRT